MEQISQHEWVKTGIVYQDRCIHCYVHKFTSAATSFFLDLYGNKTVEEPACITRTTVNEKDQDTPPGNF
jgi:hypothetical protein